MKYDITSIKNLFKDKDKIRISFSTDWRTFENAGYDPDQARFSFTISQDGELLEWDKDEGLESKVIPNTWHDLECICEGYIYDETDEPTLAEDLDDQPGFYNLCNDVLKFVKQ